MPSHCRWGILGTANIARKNWKAIRLAGNSTLTAIASRDVARAKAYIDECQSDVAFPTTPVACGSYEDLLKQSDVDAVYIPLPTGIRREWVIKAAEAGKHILCEKPCGCTTADVRAMLDACKAHKVQFMDGVMFMHSGRLPQLRKVLDDGESVGTLQRIVSQFSFAAPDEFLRSNIRVSSDLEPLGCLGDLGWYNLRFALWVMKYRLPERVSGRILAEHGSGKTPVPMEFSGELFFPGGVSAAFYCAFRTVNQQWAHISGTKGAISIPDFVLPFYGCESGFEVNQPFFRVDGCSFHMESHPRRFAVREYSEGVPGAQEVNMIRTFSEIVTSGKIDPTWGDIALKTQIVLDACLQSARAGGSLVDVSKG
ncbi:MAG TPA: Gfo/Idh/MocA family oxidoreductase [Gemmata sp.]|jgi:predicted dehydrogenase|nr:Gfo/Idh/MocA family oxidoreductase [Gemmata sp.]